MAPKADKQAQEPVLAGSLNLLSMPMSLMLASIPPADSSLIQNEPFMNCFQDLKSINKSENVCTKYAKLQLIYWWKTPKPDFTGLQSVPEIPTYWCSQNMRKHYSTVQGFFHQQPCPHAQQMERIKILHPDMGTLQSAGKQCPCVCIYWNRSISTYPSTYHPYMQKV